MGGYISSIVALLSVGADRGNLSHFLHRATQLMSCTGQRAGKYMIRNLDSSAIFGLSFSLLEAVVKKLQTIILYPTRWLKLPRMPGNLSHRCLYSLFNPVIAFIAFLHRYSLDSLAPYSLFSTVAYFKLQTIIL